MGLASSQARLLSITARLTSNEYESQQISNAKMRLANKSQEASEIYLAALNDTQFSYISFNSNGDSVKTPLTVATMYEYADDKNQYILTNSAGKVLLTNKDIQNYKSSSNLEEFLTKYGVGRSFKTTTLEGTWSSIFDSNGEHLSKYAQYWDYAVEHCGYAQATWANDKISAQNTYMEALSEYNSTISRQANGDDISLAEINEKQRNMESKREVFKKLVSYRSAKESKVVDMALNSGSSSVAVSDDMSMTYDELYSGYQAYKEALAQYQDELDKLGISSKDSYEYDNKSKAQWYTNLWYRLNGSSTDNTGAQNYASFNIKDGIREAKDGKVIVSDDAALLNSSVWISNAISKGLVSIEQASFSAEEFTLSDNQNPFSYDLHGISWNGKMYSTISDIVTSDNDKSIAKAEAEYQRKTAEINAIDEKYQRKLNLLDSEHNAIQTEYESVKNAMNKNIDRSFKAFQG